MEIVDNIRPCTTSQHPIAQHQLFKFSKTCQSNTELQALKNYILKIETQIFALKIHVKCELSTLAIKTETAS